jgi:hypothetical protein
LADAARRNVASFRPRSRMAAASIEVVDGDATVFELPPDPLVVFLYNPFPAPVMATVLENLRRSLRVRPREAYVLYVNPVERGPLDAAPFLERTAARKDFAIYRAAEELAARRAIQAA